MALKDWKKLRGINRWETDNDQIDVGLRGKHGWSVVSIYGKFNEKYFKTKSEALAYAKSYMRTH